MTTPATAHTAIDNDTLLERRIVAEALADALSDPPHDPWPEEQQRTLTAAWDLIRDEHTGARRENLSLGELPPADADATPLAAWLARPAGARFAVLRRVLGHVVSRDCPPCETEYVPSHDSATRSQHMADLTGFYRAFGVWPDNAHPRRPDHAQFIVGFAALLLAKRCIAVRDEGPASEHAAICADALARFLEDHLAWWIPTFARLVELRAAAVLDSSDPAERAAAGELTGVSRVLRAWVAVERLAAGLEPVRRIVQPYITPIQIEEESCNECGPCTLDETPE